jgi:hypothetical protein
MDLTRPDESEAAGKDTPVHEKQASQLVSTYSKHREYRLSEVMRDNIRKIRIQLDLNYEEIGKMFGISKNLVCRYAHPERYRVIPSGPLKRSSIINCHLCGRNSPVGYPFRHKLQNSIIWLCSYCYARTIRPDVPIIEELLTNHGISIDKFHQVTENYEFIKCLEDIKTASDFT